MLVRWPTTLLFLLAGAACSPINANREISAAQDALRAAKSAGADRFATYEYASATEYLHKAREENNYSDYDAARIYAAHARDLAQEARARAEREHGRIPDAQPERSPEMEGSPPEEIPTQTAAPSTSASVDDGSPVRRNRGGNK